jgi:hypothetical protein
MSISLDVADWGHPAFCDPVQASQASAAELQSLGQSLVAVELALMNEVANSERGEARRKQQLFDDCKAVAMLIAALLKSGAA